MLKSYTGDISMLGKAEQFLDACIKVPHLKASLEFFQLKQQLDDIVQDISIVFLIHILLPYLKPGNRHSFKSL